MHVLDPIPVELVKAKRPIQPDHRHKCATCGFEWDCAEFTLADCQHLGVFRAAQVNGEGPHCYMCMYLEMARRHAQLRGLKLDFTLTPAAS